MMKEIEAFYRYLEFLARMVLGRPVTVKPVPGSTDVNAEENESLAVGYTTAEGEIYILWEHPLMKGQTPEEKEYFRIGVFTHEVLHQILTDFDALLAATDVEDLQEQQMIQMFANLVEDPAIEYFAPVPRLMQQALRFAINWTFYKSPGLEESETPLIQLVNALVMYGDTGELKGEFTFPEAEHYYQEIIPEFVMEISDRDAAFRPFCARSWVDLIRPLWEQKGSEGSPSLEDLLEQLRKRGKGMAVGSGSPTSSPAEPGKEKEEAMKDRMDKVAGGDDDDPGEAGTSEGSGDTETEETGKAASKDKSDSEGEGAGAGEDGMSPDTTDGGMETTASGGGGIAVTSRKTRTVILRPSLSEDDGELLARAEESIKDIKKDIEKEKEGTTLPTYTESVAGGDTKPFTVVNTAMMDMVDEDDIKVYQALRKDLGGTPDSLAKVLRELMRRHMTETFHSCHGRLNVRRWATGMSQHVFDRKVTEKNCGGTHLFMAIDLSGSMQGMRINMARNCAIIFAETCKILKIPLMVMGYTSEIGGRTLDHYHYMRNGSEKERTSLAKIGTTTMYENADGYSFRYLEQEVRRSKAERKIVIILTDGFPASPEFYEYGDTQGQRDTKDAFNRLKRAADGILAFGLNTDEEDMKKIYGNSFVQVDNVTKLPQIVAGRFKKFF